MRTYNSTEPISNLRIGVKKSWARPRIANRTTIGWKCLGDNFHIFDTLLYVGYSSPNLSISEWLGCVQLSCFSLKPLLSLLCFACHCYGIVRVTMLCVGVPSKQNNKLNSWRRIKILYRKICAMRTLALKQSETRGALFLWFFTLF